MALAMALSEANLGQSSSGPDSAKTPALSLLYDQGWWAVAAVNERLLDTNDTELFSAA